MARRSTGNRNRANPAPSPTDDPPVDLTAEQLTEIKKLGTLATIIVSVLLVFVVVSVVLIASSSPCKILMTRYTRSSSTHCATFIKKPYVAATIVG